MLPNFMIVGAPKAGTTSLYHYLSQHPEVFMSSPKEVNFFSYEELVQQNLYYDDFKVDNVDKYKKLFTHTKGEKAVGEASVSYLFYPKTPQKIKETIPDVKIIILLREPTSRAYSHYLMDYKLGLVDVAFEDIVYELEENTKSNLFYQQYISLGLYYEQVKRYIDIFGKDKIRIYFQDDFKNDPSSIIADICDFLGVDSNYRPKISKEYNVFSMPKSKIVDKVYKSSFRPLISSVLPQRIKEKIIDILFVKKQRPKMSNETRKYLQGIYRDDIINLERLIEVDLSSWKK
jgi:hypothetical protein